MSADIACCEESNKLILLTCVYGSVTVTLKCDNFTFSFEEGHLVLTKTVHGLTVIIISKEPSELFH